MSLPLNPPFRAEQIGSLKRPAELLAKREEFHAGKCTREELKAVEDEAIKNEIKRQHSCGIKGVTDGEFRRHMFWDGFHNNLDGMEVIQNPGRELFKMYVPDIKAFFESHASRPGDTMVCTGKLVRNKPMYRPEFEYVASQVKPEEVKNVKITLAAPEWYHLRHGEHAFDRKVYPSEVEYFADLAKAYREELADLYEAGCRNVQFDDPLLAYFCAVPMLEGMKAEGIEPSKVLDQYIQLYNDCVRDAPSDMVIGLHLCRGNFKDGMHFSEGGYEHISKKLFKELNAQVYYLEYDTARAGGFEPLADLPQNKIVVLGLVTSKFPQLEDKQDLINRINEAADFVAKGNGISREQALKQLAISPQCGFASHAEGNPVSSDDVLAKLTLVSDVAKAVWSDA
ncbi:cobalamin-independent methionine synthase II family protein [Rhodotorula paludigena]|uniref:cobalamin-independent methionine synthase II family protein n=1 Tax=Rhodotorula paludigena TaxID=86838 RepID=UPI0031752153